uniref:Tubulin tyrosine ligase-like family, member 12 n=1 Tax=Eptatretus burgeri TaxID=7764 RepID=A0A8C4X0P8_EPTBU
MAASDEHAPGVSRSEACSQTCKKDDWHDDEAFRHFVALHGPSLRLSGLPEVYWPRLHHKLRNEVFDAGDVFGIMIVQQPDDDDDDDDEEGGGKEDEGAAGLECEEHVKGGKDEESVPVEEKQDMKRGERMMEAEEEEEVKVLIEEEMEEGEEKERSAKGMSEWESEYKVLVTQEGGLSTSDPDSIFLIDHAWTFRRSNMHRDLVGIPGLAHRMAEMMGIGFHGEIPDADLIGQIMSGSWYYSQTYSPSLASAEQRVPVWYIMDEFGSRIQHADKPTCRTAPLYYIPGQQAFTLLWPLKDLAHGDEVTRDFAYGELDPLVRTCRLMPWQPADISHISAEVSEPPIGYFEAIFAENKQILPVPIEPTVFSKDKVFRVFTDNPQVAGNLHHPRFVLVDAEEDADILFLNSETKDYRQMSKERPTVMLSQFPGENLVTVKDCLAAIGRRSAKDNVKGSSWLPITFNLRTELPQFVRYFLQRQSRGEDNHWICKPWNLARGLDTHVCNNLHEIIRHRESTPKVVCKYIEQPVLFHREDVGKVKFDIRYVVLLRSVQPLSLYVYDVFWLRFANRPFSLDDLDDFEKHFTVMNYTDGVQLKQINCDEFIPQFEAQYPKFKWRDIQEKIFQAIVELFRAATSKPPPMGICPYPQSRAVYAVDLMLKWESDAEGKETMQQQILEVNFNPDCERACRFHPSFFDDIFSTLFLDVPEGRHVTRLC